MRAQSKESNVSFRHAGAGSVTARPRTTAHRIALAALMAVVFIFVTIADPQLARAGTYDVAVCGTGDGSAGTADGISSANDPGSYGYMDTLVFCTSGSPSIYQHAYVPNASYSSWTWNGNGWWKLSAPDNTMIASMTMRQTFNGFQSYFTFDLTTPDGRLLQRAATWGGGAMVPSGTRTFIVNARSITGRFYCALSSCSGTGTSVMTDRIYPRIEDQHAPTFESAPSGSLLSSDPVRGVRGVAYDASDLGGGVYQAALVIDGVAVKTVAVGGNGGHCVKPFVYLVPCQLRVSGSISLDTTTLREGEHQAQVAVTDATETNTTLSAPTTITVDNVALPSGGPPSIAGELYAGTTLTAKPGSWSNAQGGFSFAWLRCDAAGDGCEQIATGATYTLALPDVGHAIRLRTTAANSAGETTTTTTQPTALVAERTASATGSSGIAGSSPTPASGSDGSGAPNGRNAGASATLRVSFARGRQTFRTGWGARRVRVTGRLLNAATGLPIAGAMVEEISRSSALTAKDAPSRWLRTDESGVFSMLVPRNAPGQSLTFQYRPQTGTATPVVASARLRLRVVAKIAWRASSSRRILRFTGRLSRPVPVRPVQYVEVQWRRGTRWATLAHPIRVRSNGTWSLSYPVGANVATGARFRFRAAIRSISPNYPYEATKTRARWVTVR